MWQTKLQEIIDINNRFNERINNGATDEDIKVFLENIEDNDVQNALQSYLTFLKVVNGLEFNGYIFYGIDQHLLSYTPKQQINGFIDNNEVWNDLEWERKYVFFGDSSISWYVYDIESTKYYELDKPSGDVMETYDSLELMLDKVLVEALL